MHAKPVRWRALLPMHLHVLPLDYYDSSLLHLAPVSLARKRIGNDRLERQCAQQTHAGAFLYAVHACARAWISPKHRPTQSQRPAPTAEE